jgi:hypothetical protein
VPTREYGGERECIEVVKVCFLYTDSIRDEREGENISTDAVMSVVGGRCVVVSRDAVGIVEGDARGGNVSVGLRGWRRSGGGGGRRRDNTGIVIK